MVKTHDTKTIAIGLQGGGSHSAFAWGVLDELLDKVAEGDLRIAAISGASGGALNGAVCAYGMRESPRAAQDGLRKFWRSVSQQSLWPPNPLQSVFPADSPKRWNVDLNPLTIGVGMAEQISSPYMSPFDLHDSLRPLLAEAIPDFGAFAATDGKTPQLFVSATAVDRMALRIFGPAEITVDALLASACLPTLFKAVTIEGTPYWDGGYLANPALNPLVDRADDILTVLIDPLIVKSGAPELPRQIVNRINEVSFGASWVLEMRQIALINKLCKDKPLAGGKYKPKHLHVISSDDYMEAIGAASKMVPSWDFLHALHAEGRKTARDWLQENFDKIGRCSSFDVDEKIDRRLKGSEAAVSETKSH